MSLYHKYRPTNLAKMKGNSDTLFALQGMLDKERRNSCPHSFLLYGPTGCGKTTVGRIIATELDCTGEDFKEINSADFRGIDTIREIIQNSYFLPLQSNTRVFLIDECHKLTNDAQNALLKVLEDPPVYVYFILCTTEPQKLLGTIKGRCTNIEMKPLSDSQMYQLLKKIVMEEEKELEKEIYDQIIADSQGYPRTAIQILEKVLLVPAKLQLETARKSAETTSEIIDLCRALMNNQPWNKIKIILTGLKDQDPESIRRVLLGYAQAILLKAENSRAAAVIETFYEPTYNIGFPGITYGCYLLTKNTHGFQ